MSLITRFMVWVEDQKGQTMAEYGLILALVAVVVIAGITLLGGNLLAFFNTLAGNFHA